MTAQPVSPPSTRPPRLDLFLPVHKGLRLALADLLLQLGSTDFYDPRAATAAVDQLELVTAFCDDHKRTEDAIVMPTLLTRLSGQLPSIAHAHEDQARHIEELRATGKALLNAPATTRPIVGRTLYLHFSTFTAENLAHMAEEEQVLSPLFERLFSEDEVRGIHAKAMAFLTPAAHGRGAPFILRALSRPERVNMVTGALATMPREVVIGLVEVIRPTLPADDFTDLLSRTGLSS